MSRTIEDIETPWAKPQEYDAPWYEDVWNGVKDFGVGIVQDLASLVGMYGEDGWGWQGWDGLLGNWEAMAGGLVGLVGFYGPDGWGWQGWGNLGDNWLGLVNAFVPYREWDGGNGAGYVITQSVLNIGSCFLGGAGVVKGLIRAGRRGDADVDVDSPDANRVDLDQADLPGQQSNLPSTQDLQNSLDDLDLDTDELNGLDDALRDADGFDDVPADNTPDSTTDNTPDREPVNVGGREQNGDGGQQQGDPSPTDGGGDGPTDPPNGDSDGPGDQQGQGDQNPGDGNTSDPDNADPDNADPDNADPDNADPDNADPDNADPDNADPDNADPDNADPDNADPDNADPDNADPDNADPDNADPDGADPDHDGADPGGHTDPLPGRVEDGIRRFDSDADGERYGEERLGDVYRNLPPDLQNAVRWYTRQSFPNPFLRPGADLPAALHRAWNSVQPGWHLFEMNGGRPPSIADIYDASRRTDLTPDQRSIVDDILRRPDPEARLEEWLNYSGHRGFLARYFDGFPSEADFWHRIDEIDRALDQPLPEGVQVQRGLHDVSFMDGFDPSNPRALEGTTQTEPAYMSTSLGRTPAVVDGNPFKFNLHINVPEGSPGLWMGKQSVFDDQRELILPRGTRYRINSVTPNAHGGYDIDADVLP
ncbi:ADP-ribosyltransferase [Actinomadura alba]|uniref:ADP ribosyltransferase domain-containing protein n=2 Tax=Actinomadura alba TaxID=406431 RepID=A0ABR7LNK3_9ACTN|nr:ADP-ribosyltransferase [Actinomadura alba]MBC6466060.1 hypothetical protein [Actinomadura alba]